MTTARRQRVAFRGKSCYVQRAVKYATIPFSEICDNVAVSDPGS